MKEDEIKSTRERALKEISDADFFITVTVGARGAGVIHVGARVKLLEALTICELSRDTSFLESLVEVKETLDDTIDLHKRLAGSALWKAVVEVMEEREKRRQEANKVKSN